jgi:hypothetical protein
MKDYFSWVLDQFFIKARVFRHFQIAQHMAAKPKW